MGGVAGGQLENKVPGRISTISSRMWLPVTEKEWGHMEITTYR